RPGSAPWSGSSSASCPPVWSAGLHLRSRRSCQFHTWAFVPYRERCPTTRPDPRRQSAFATESPCFDSPKVAWQLRRRTRPRRHPERYGSAKPPAVGCRGPRSTAEVSAVPFPKADRPCPCPKDNASRVRLYSYLLDIALAPASLGGLGGGLPHHQFWRQPAVL